MGGEVEGTAALALRQPLEKRAGDTGSVKLRLLPAISSALDTEIEQFLDEGYLPLQAWRDAEGFAVPERMLLPGAKREIVDLDQLQSRALFDKDPVAVRAWDFYQEHLKRMDPREKTRRFPHPYDPKDLELDRMICKTLYGRIGSTSNINTQSTP